MIMNKRHCLNLVGIPMLLAGAGAHADFADRLYVTAAAGPAFAQNTTIQTPPFTGGQIDFDTGVRGDIAVGYNVCKAFAVELNTGVIWNSVNSIGGNTLSTYSAHADLYQIPLMVNGIYKIPLKGPFKPYIGAGVGAVVGVLDSSGVPGLYFPTPGGSQSFDATDTEFAYQAEVGFNWQLGKHAEVGLAYKFLGTSSFTWNANDTPLKTDGIFTHAVTASFTWCF
jgi:OmpA-OmpF porin, OOP family